MAESEMGNSPDQRDVSELHTNPSAGSLPPPATVFLDDATTRGNVVALIPATHVTPGALGAHGGGLPQAGGRVPQWGNLPQRLIAPTQWVIASADKVPRFINSSGDLSVASVTNPATWMTFEAATDAAYQRGMQIGRVLVAGERLTVIDIDVPDGGALTSPQQAILSAFDDCYIERSMSGRGYHIWVEGSIGDGVRHGGVEVYSDRRYMVSTGDVVNAKPILDRETQLHALVREMAYHTVDRRSVTLEEVAAPKSDREIFDIASRADNAEKFNRLWNCAVAQEDKATWQAMGYPSQSEADLALLSMFTFYSKSNEQCRRLFRLSGLGQRPKATDDDKYLNRTLRLIRAREMREAQQLAGVTISMFTGIPTHVAPGAPMTTSFQPFKTTPLPEFLAESPTIEFLIDDMLRRGWLYACTGQPGAGKTGIGVVMALAVVSAGSVGKHACNGGPVLYIASENPEDVNQRFRIAVARSRLQDVTLAHIHVLDQSFLLKDRLVELERVIDQLGVVFVVVDTDQAVSLGGGSSEIDNDTRMAHAKNLRRLTRRPTRPTVLDLCHPNAAAGPDALRPRGGSSMLAEIDGNIMLSRDGETATFRSDPGKFRGEPFNIEFRSQLVRSPLIVDTKQRQIPVPYFSPMNENEEAMEKVSAFTDRQRLLNVMLIYPAWTQSAWAKELGWTASDGMPNRSKINKFLKRMRDEKPPLVDANDQLTASGKRLAKGAT